MGNASTISYLFSLLAACLSAAVRMHTFVGCLSCSRFLPGPLAQLAVMGHSFGLASGSSRARASFLATQRAAAAAGPGAVGLYEAYVSDSEQSGDSEGSWQKAALRYCLGSAQVRSSLFLLGVWELGSFCCSRLVGCGREAQSHVEREHAVKACALLCGRHGYF
jgi:hypothetical protein